MFNFLPTVTNANNGIVEGLQNLASTILTMVRNMALPICAILLIFLGLTVMTATDPQSVASAKKWGIRILVGFLIIMFAPTILDTLKAFTSSVGFTW